MNLTKIDYVIKKMEDINILNHSERTAILCYNLARELYFEPKDLEIAYVAGLLHEIGKIDLPKTLKINNVEVKGEDIYPYFSASMVNCFEDFDSILEILSQGLENVDGSGLRGLSEDKISRIAKILRICDYYDTCRSSGLSHDETTKKIRENSDIIFPKKLITPFIKSLLKEGLHLEY